MLFERLAIDALQEMSVTGACRLLGLRARRQRAALLHALHAWAIERGLKPIIRVAAMLERHFGRIRTYFRLRASNARAEGLNNKIQTIKKKAYGFRNVERFINAIYFRCGGLRLHPH